ncbi:hypothetical protein [Runella slithyformis]|uniref:Cycloisomerase n=1 Tax=Runella slithyformis (strain ATCC 29530 / DSM 19594 / LMG 11500 / NCIMB 11436 / LSU 4) TaxID=761193 RepID=A0A7U4E7X8_RUNSL|nr:hypothetical protein [Runella slithyformis]AEI50859.1 hypothetical protein Runsl_4537 [Runella slithyformis DSM 19594]
MHKAIYYSSFITVISISVHAQQAKELKRFQLKEVKQGVAVDAAHFYVINNFSITKHTKSNAKQVAVWKDTTGVLKHLNSGVVLGNKLYCAHSNYPDKPMASSIEIFDAATLKHIDTHSFGLFPGSATWLDFRQGHWWVAFANYSDKNSDGGRDNRRTTLVKFTPQWQQVEAWAFPAQVLEAFSPKSTSGGAWGNDGLLYCTGHDKPELYVLRLPERGAVLQYVKTIPTVSEGQGFSIDHSVKNTFILYGITRTDNYVLVSKVE